MARPPSRDPTGSRLRADTVRPHLRRKGDSTRQGLPHIRAEAGQDQGRGRTGIEKEPGISWDQRVIRKRRLSEHGLALAPSSSLLTSQ